VLLATQEDLDAAGLFYAMKSQRCWMCNRPLTVPVSLYAGRGQKCARKEWRLRSSPVRH
jgi:hypothetical protein